MRVNNVFNKGETISVVLPSKIDDLVVYQYIYGQNKTTLPYTVRVVGSFSYIIIAAINIDCCLFIKYNGVAEFARVGNPPSMVLAHIINKTTLPFIQYDYNSNVVSSGVLDSLGDDFYCTYINYLNKSFFVINNTIITTTLPNKYIVNTSTTNGSIILYRDEWQLIAIPKNTTVKYGFVDAVALQENVDASELFEVISAYPGMFNKFLSYIPGFTLDTSEQNFNLILNDNGYEEITAFWVKCKPWAHTQDNIVFNWVN